MDRSFASYIKYFTKYMNSWVYAVFAYIVQCIKRLVRVLRVRIVGTFLNLLGREQRLKMDLDKHVCINQCWGVGSPRHCAGFPISQEEYHIPIGCCVAKWNMKTKERHTIQLHNDVITVMLINQEHVILTVSFNGDLKLYDKEYKLLSSLKLPCEDVIFGCWSPDGKTVAVCSKNGMLVVYSLKALLEQDTNGLWQYTLPQEETSENGDIKKCNYFVESVFKENLQLIAGSQVSKSVYLYLYEKDGSLIKSVQVSPLGDESVRFLCFSDVCHNIVAVGLNHGIFAFYDIDSLEMQTFFQTSSGCQACAWHDSLFLTISYLSGLIMAWSKDGTLLHEIKGAPTGSIISMTPLLKTNSFMIGGQMSLHQITLTSDYKSISERSDLSFLQLSGCGIGVSDHGIVASGDLSGCLLLWKDDMIVPFHKVSLPSSVRTLLWFKEFVLVGLLSGELYVYDGSKLDLGINSVEGDNRLNMFHHFNGSVLCMRVNGKKNALSIGTSTGNLCLFDIKIIDHQLSLTEISNTVVHKPQVISGDERPMEIWNLAWNPEDKLIATVSEDKTCIISSLTGEQLHMLIGHTTAVTSVDWKILLAGTDMLTTCADDRTVRLYNGGTFQLLHIIQPIYLYGWYTLTYLCLNVKKNMVVCCTENGFLVAWDLQNYNCILKCKLHTGSIEGLLLDEKEEFLFSTSSDCVVNKFTI